MYWTSKKKKNYAIQLLCPKIDYVITNLPEKLKKGQ